MSGYARIHRSLIGHPAFRNESETMLFAWMVLKAAWRPTRVRYKGHSISLKRGQLAASIRDMADAHDRNKNWISRVLNTMRDEDMIQTDAGTGVLVITVCNYDEYQSDSADSGTANGTPRGTDEGTRAGQRRDTEQEEKNIKREELSLTRTPAREPSLPDDMRQIMEEAGLTTPQNPSQLKAWYEAGADLSDILTVVRRETQKLRDKGQPPRFLKVFDPAIREKLEADRREIEHYRRISRRFQADEAAEAERLRTGT